MAVNVIDEPCFTKERIVLTQNELNIPGLVMFGYYSSPSAAEPIEEHYHHDAIEITYMVHGGCTYHSENETYRMKKSSLLVMESDVVHTTQQQGQMFDINSQYWFKIDTKSRDSLLFLDRKHSNILMDRLVAMGTTLMNTQPSAVEPILSSVFRHFCSSDQDYRNAGSHLLCYLLESIAVRDSSFIRKSDENDEIIMRLSDDIRKNPVDYDVPIESLASMCHMGLTTFKSRFTQTTGLSPREFVNREKIERSKNLLDKGMSVTDTAMDMGFPSGNYFATVFRKFTGMTPTEYRRLK